MMNTTTLQTSYAAHFNAKPAFLVRAPGRVNLIGEHTDYNDGFAMPIAIDRAAFMALAPREDSCVHVYSLDYQEEVLFSLNDLQRATGWGEYIKGVAHELLQEGKPLRGFDAILTGDIPRGAGLSSSAAVELAAARAFAAVSDLAWNPVFMAHVAQRAENRWVGVQCGILDQMASAASQAGKAMLLDCRSLQYELVPVPASIAIVILDTGTRRGLVHSAYNERREQCETAAQALHVQALRDATMSDLEKAKDTISAVVFQRARHILAENERTLQAARAMRAGNMKRLGELFNESHASLRDDFEVTNAALNLMTECAQAQSACYGARMTGAGFGGCAIALVDEQNAQAFSAVVAEEYQRRSGQPASIYVCKPSAGASAEALDVA
ncbi:MAG: galactokinase [Anaerolineales bacterium]